MISSVRILACGIFNEECYFRMNEIEHPSGLIGENTGGIGIARYFFNFHRSVSSMDGGLFTKTATILGTGEHTFVSCDSALVGKR